MIVVDSKTLRIKTAYPLLSRTYLNPFEYRLDSKYSIMLVDEGDLDDSELLLVTRCECSGSGIIILEKL